jgi:hypothetical protein
MRRLASIAVICGLLGLGLAPVLAQTARDQNVERYKKLLTTELIATGQRHVDVAPRTLGRDRLPERLAR